MATASCITKQWSGSYAPQVKLEVKSADTNGGTATLSWTLYYITHGGYAASVATARAYTVTINGKTYSGTYDIDGVTGTKTIRTGTLTVSKDTSAQTIKFSVSFDFNLTWAGVYEDTLVATGTISVSAKTKYTISYHANGGTGVPASQSKWYGTALTLSTTNLPTRTGYTFLGWSTSSTATSATWKAGGSYTTNASDTLYAVWKINIYTVSYNANGGTGAPAKQTKTYGKPLTLSATIPEKDDYTFLGWSTSSTATSATWKAGGSYTTNASDVLYAVWKLAYSKPKISNYSVIRCDSSGTANDAGTSARVKFSWSTTNDVSKITIAATSSEGSVTETVSASGKSGSVNVIFGTAFGLSAEVTWAVKITVTDSGGSTSLSKSLPGFIIPFDALAGGNGVSFGKPAEISGYADFRFKTRYRDNLLIEHDVDIYGIDGNGLQRNVFTPCNAEGNTVVGYDNYINEDGKTYIYGHNVVIGVSSGSSRQTFRPYFSKNDPSFNIVIRTAGFVANSGKDVYFIVPLTKPVVGSPTISVASVNGFQLRQNGNYTHDSSATVYALPSSYTVSISSLFGITIKATFPTATNAVNNHVIGVYWSGTITFS